MSLVFERTHPKEPTRTFTSSAVAAHLRRSPSSIEHDFKTGKVEELTHEGYTYRPIKKSADHPVLTAGGGPNRLQAKKDCPHCKGTGLRQQAEDRTGPATKCPVCKGTGSVAEKYTEDKITTHANAYDRRLPVVKKKKSDEERILDDEANEDKYQNCHTCYGSGKHSKANDGKCPACKGEGRVPRRYDGIGEPVKKTAADEPSPSEKVCKQCGSDQRDGDSCKQCGSDQVEAPVKKAKAKLDPIYGESAAALAKHPGKSLTPGEVQMASTKPSSNKDTKEALGVLARHGTVVPVTKAAAKEPEGGVGQRIGKTNQYKVGDKTYRKEEFGNDPPRKHEENKVKKTAEGTSQETFHQGSDEPCTECKGRGRTHSGRFTCAACNGTGEQPKPKPTPIKKANAPVKCPHCGKDIKDEAPIKAAAGDMSRKVPKDEAESEWTGKPAGVKPTPPKAPPAKPEGAVGGKGPGNMKDRLRFQAHRPEPLNLTAEEAAQDAKDNYRGWAPVE